MAKFVTLEVLQNKNLLCLDNFSFKHIATASANGGYKQIANVVMEDYVWASKRICFLACNSSGSMGIYFLSARFRGSYSDWQDLKFCLYGDSFRANETGKVRCFYSSETKTFSFWVRNLDWNYTHIKEIFSTSKNGVLNILTGDQASYDAIPSSAGTEVECRVGATDYDVQNAIDTNIIKVTESDITNLFGGGVN